MAKFLLINTEGELVNNWRLPDEIDVERLRSQLESAMRDGILIRVTVMIGSKDNDQHVPFLLNGGKLVSATVVELAREEDVANLSQ